MFRKEIFFVLVLIVIVGLVMTESNVQATGAPLHPVQDPFSQAAFGTTLYEATVARAASQRPNDAECDDPDAGVKMKCQYQKYTDAICETSSLAQTDTTGFLAAKKDKLQKYCDSTQAWLDAPGREEEFKKSFRKGGESCYVEEITGDVDENGDAIGNEDGVCTKGEQNKNGCVEIDDDDIGDDDGICEVTRTGPGKKVWEPCAEVCDIEDTGREEDDENVDVELMDMVGSTLELAAEDLDSYNATAQTMIQEWQAVSSYNVETFNTVNVPVYDPGKCMGLMLYEVDPYSAIVESKVSPINKTRTDRPIGYHDLDFHRVNAQYSAILGEVCDDAASVDFKFGVGVEKGGSTQAWCSLFHAMDAMLIDLSEGLAMLDDEITGTRIDNTTQCLEYVSKNLQGMQSTLNYKVEWRRIHMQVIELTAKQEFLIYATEFGRADHPMAVKRHVEVSNRDGSGFVDITSNSSWVEIEPGVYLVKITLPKNLRNAELFWFQIGHTEQIKDEAGDPVLGEDGSQMSVEHSGSMIFDRSNPGSGCTGQ